MQVNLTSPSSVPESHAAFGWSELLTVSAPPSSKFHALDLFTPRFIQQAGRWRSDCQAAQSFNTPDSKMLTGIPPCHRLAWDNGMSLAPKVCGWLTHMLFSLCMSAHVIKHKHTFLPANKVSSAPRLCIFGQHVLHTFSAYSISLS